MAPLRGKRDDSFFPCISFISQKGEKHTMNTWKVVVAKPGKKAEIRVIPAVYESLKELVGGPVEVTFVSAAARRMRSLIP